MAREPGGEKIVNPNPMMSNGNNCQRLFRLLLGLLLAVLAAGLGYVLSSLPSPAPGLSKPVAEHLEASGVSNPVTAVLLNYRAYDTLLELGVLLLAPLGVWSLGVAARHREPLVDPVLDMLARLLVPMLILVAGYLLWAGAHAPGGAFQAGSVLAAAGVLLLLSGWWPGPAFSGLPLRVSLTAGPGVFLVAGVALMFAGGRMLEYPPPFAGALILLIEAAATWSIGITLAALFAGGRPVAGPHR